MNRTQLLQKQVECPVCMDQFQTPKMLPCQHSVCLQCLQGIHDNDRGLLVKCPECRQQHRVPANGIEGFPTSVVIQRLIEAMSQPNVPQLQPPTASYKGEKHCCSSSYTRRANCLEEAEDVVRLITLMNQQEEIERRNKRNTNIRNLQARLNTSRTGLQLHQDKPQLAETCRDLAPINFYTELEPTFACTDRTLLNSNTDQSQIHPYTVLEPIQPNTTPAPTYSYTRLAPTYYCTNQPQINPYTVLAPITPYPIQSPIYPYAGLTPINTDTYTALTNTSTNITQIHTNTYTAPRNTNTYIAPRNTNTYIRAPRNTNTYIRAPRYTDYCTPPNISFNWHGGF